ncbi:MAG TPA: NAD-dependent epimerase/dehydratase family protein [Micromonosporaceae bacterium]|nr:NAD-dependent epimerase/dehydratase family protein [Micromonosporaceae bacterium]
MRTVVVTGVGRFLGANVAARLAADPGVGRVIGVDHAPAPDDLEEALDRTPSGHASVVVVHADLRTSEIADVIADAKADAVVHLAVVTSPDGYPGGRAGMKEQNVIGTMQVLAACQQAPSVRKVVIRSSTAAYGASFRDPAIFTEDTEPREVPRGGFARDILDIEGYVRGFRRRRPDVAATVLRFVPFVGGRVNTRLTRYFAQPAVPTVIGRDPRLQFLHIDDAIEVLYRSITEDHPGTFNVAGPGVLLLSQAIRRAGRLAVPVLEFGMSGAAALAKRVNILGLSLDQVDLFVHGRVVDISRLIKEYGYTPRSTADAFVDFVQAREPGVLHAERVAAAERAILDGIRQVRSGRN